MTLTNDDLAVLKKPFPRADHEFLKEFVYLTEEAICNRIEEVDPAWTFELQRAERVGTQAVVCARLTICGVSREGIGMQQVNEKAGEPEKGSATDSLKRCARLFGIGRYLLDAPGPAQFDKWLAEKQKAAGILPLRPTPAAMVPLSSSASTPASPASNGGSDEPLIPASWLDAEGAWNGFLKSAKEKLTLTSRSVEAALEEFAEMRIADWHTSRNWALAALVAYAKDYNREAISDYTSVMAGKPEDNLKLDSMAQTIAMKYMEGKVETP